MLFYINWFILFYSFKWLIVICRSVGKQILFFFAFFTASKLSSLWWNGLGRKTDSFVGHFQQNREIENLDVFFRKRNSIIFGYEMHPLYFCLFFMQQKKWAAQRSCLQGIPYLLRGFTNLPCIRRGRSLLLFCLRLFLSEIKSVTSKNQ